MNPGVASRGMQEMRHNSPAIRGLVALLALTAPLLGTATAHATTAAAQPWQLVDYHQNLCYSPNVTSSYYGIWIKGTWNHRVNVGINGLPTGGSYTTSYAPIAAGSSTGEYSLAYVDAAIPASTPQGTYTARLWADDGTRRDRVPVTLTVQARCGY